jgi:hypothetical protein
LKAARTPFIVASSYLAIILALWLPFSLHSGFPYETGLVYTSEISTWWSGFLLGADYLRIYTSIFYQVAYLTGELSGFAGSFVPYQIVYAALWWARGFLVFLIGRRLAPGHDLFWYLAGALMLVHSSDYTVGWAGQLNQFGFALWMSLALYALVLAFQQADRLHADVALVVAVFFEHLSLWSYESQLLIILIAPLLLLCFHRQSWRSRLALVGPWYLVPAIYLVATIKKYVRDTGHTYQESVLRKTWSVGSILSDWLFNISASLKFWTWAGAQPAHTSTSQLVLPTVLAVGLFLVGMGVVAWSSGAWIPDRRTLWTVMLVGFILLALSFPAYLILESARSLWRTQILSGFGAALVMSAAIGLSARYAPRAWLQLSAIALFGALVVGYGGFSAVKKAESHRWIWERQRSAMAQILGVVPRLKSGTLMIMTNVPKGNDPFQPDDIWFDMALRLAYPGTAVAGAYFFQDGTPAKGNDLKIFPSGDWKFEANRLVRKGDVGGILVLDFQQDGVVSIARTLPSLLGIDENAARLYNPETRVLDGNPSPRAVKRYGTNGDWLSARP